MQQKNTMPEQFLIGGEWRDSPEVLDVEFPYTHEVIVSIYMSSQGVKTSGFEREGIKFGIEDMTKPHLMGINRNR